MRTDGVDISVCIKRPDGIHISAHDGVTYEIHFDPQNESAGYYTVSGGHYKGTGTIVGVRKAETASFKHYYYIKVLSQTTHHFAWRVAINSFSTVAHEA